MGDYNAGPPPNYTPNLTPTLDFNAPSGASLTDLATNGKNLNLNISALISAIQSIFPRVSGTFTLAAAATTTVTQTAITATSIIVFTPTSASAGTLQGSVKCLYLSARTAGASFTVATASGGNAAGTETFQYFVVNPV